MNIEQEECALIAAVDAFAERMKRRLLKKAKAGYTGWNERGTHPTDVYLAVSIHNDVNGFIGGVGEEETTMSARYREKPVDIANRAMMLWVRHGGMYDQTNPL